MFSSSRRRPGHENRELTRRMMAGDERAFDEFFATYFPALFRFTLARLGGDADAAEEIAQETLCKAIAKIHTYRGEAMLFTWLCTFCRHEISAFLRRRQRRAPEIALVEEQPDVRAALDSLAAVLAADPESSARRNEITRLVQVALDHLPPRYGAALEWKYLQGMSVKEIAGRLRLSPKAAESLLTRARGAFRESFTTLAGAELLPSSPGRP